MKISDIKIIYVDYANDCVEALPLDMDCVAVSIAAYGNYYAPDILILEGTEMSVDIASAIVAVYGDDEGYQMMDDEQTFMSATAYDTVAAALARLTDDDAA